MLPKAKAVNDAREAWQGHPLILSRPQRTPDEGQSSEFLSSEAMRAQDSSFDNGSRRKPRRIIGGASDKAHLWRANSDACLPRVIPARAGRQHPRRRSRIPQQRQTPLSPARAAPTFPVTETFFLVSQSAYR